MRTSGSTESTVTTATRSGAMPIAFKLCFRLSIFFFPSFFLLFIFNKIYILASFVLLNEKKQIHSI